MFRYFALISLNSTGVNDLRSIENFLWSFFILQRLSRLDYPLVYFVDSDFRKWWLEDSFDNFFNWLIFFGRNMGLSLWHWNWCPSIGSGAFWFPAASKKFKPKWIIIHFGSNTDFQEWQDSCWNFLEQTQT